MHKSEIDTVDVGALLAIDFDANKILVEDRGDLGVFKRLLLHHVAPVAGGVSDAQEDGFVFIPGLLESCFAPGIPIHRIVLMLAQIRRSFTGEMIAGTGRGVRYTAKSQQSVCEEYRESEAHRAHPPGG